jgi:queuine tRNA-ribosyltransferase
MLDFAIETTDGAARAGRITVRGHSFNTPVFLPVATQASVKALTQTELLDLGAQILLGNAYHLYLRPGLRLIQRAGGLAAFMRWPRATLTDSGGYQVFSLASLLEVSEEGVSFRSHIDGAEHLLTPESAVEIQHALDPDIIMAFDQPVAYPADRAQTLDATSRSDRWAQRCLSTHHQLTSRAEPALSEAKGSQPAQAPASAGSQPAQAPTSAGSQPARGAASAPSLFAIIQGGFEPDLREASARRLTALPFDGYAIGGLSVGEPKDLTFSLLDHTAPLLPADRPRYLMGVGTPADIVRAVAAGMDMFDCVLPTRLGRNGTAFTRMGKVNLKNARYQDDLAPLDADCSCQVCRTYTRGYLRHLYKSGEILAARCLSYHNLHLYLRLMEDIRQAICQGRYQQFAETLYQNSSRRRSEPPRWL